MLDYVSWVRSILSFDPNLAKQQRTERGTGVTRGILVCALFWIWVLFGKSASTMHYLHAIQFLG